MGQHPTEMMEMVKLLASSYIFSSSYPTSDTGDNLHDGNPINQSRRYGGPGIVNP